MKENKVWLISVTEDYFDKAKYLIKSLINFQIIKYYYILSILKQNLSPII